MADVQFTPTRVALKTDGTDQDITVSGIGTPVAAKFFLSRATTNGTLAADATLSIGFTDGTNHRSVTTEIIDGGASTSSSRTASNSNVFSLSTGESGVFVSWITDGVRINSDTLPAGYLLTVIFVTGADVEEALVFDRSLQTSSSAEDFTGIGFELDVLFLAHSYVSSFAALTHGPLSYGCVINDTAATPTQKSIGWCADTGASAGDQNTIASDTYALVGPLTGSNRFSVDITDIDASGFTHQTVGGTTGTLVIGLALKFAAGVSLALVDSSIPTTGNYAQADIGFTPEFGEMAHIVGPSTYDSLDTGANSGAFSLAAFDDTNIYTISASDEDGADPIVAKSMSTNAFRLLDNNSTDAAVASGYAFDSDGWDFPLTTNPAAATLGWGFAFSSGGGTPDTTAPTLTSASGTQTGSTTADLSVSTDEANGTLSWVVTTSATAPSVAQVKAGQDHTGAAAADSGSQTVTATGTQNANATGLTASTAYYAHFQHVDAAANDSTVVSSASFTTAAAAAVKGVQVTLYDATTAQASITGITAMWWDSSPPTGSPVFTTATASTDGSGVLELDLDADTALDITDPGHLMLYKLDGSDEKDSLAWQGQLSIQDIS